MAPTLHEQITGQLREQMENGTLPPGAQVPSSRALAEQWGCSRVTASDALRALARDGLILDRKGLGFFVTDTPVARPAGRRTAGSARIEGALPFKILGRPGYLIPPLRVAAALGVAEGDEALARTRLLHLPSGEPVSVVTAWFTRAMAAGSTGPRSFVPSNRLTRSWVMLTATAVHGIGSSITTDPDVYSL